MHALRQEIQPASGVEFATSLKLIPSTLGLCNVVVARSSLLRIFEVREEPAPMQAADDERARRTRRGTEPVEGEVAMDEQGDGYINIAKVISYIISVSRYDSILSFFSVHLSKIPITYPNCHSVLPYPRTPSSWNRNWHRGRQNSLVTRR